MLPRGIDHPASDDWQASAYAPMPNDAQRSLGKRYGGLMKGQEIKALADEIGIASAQDSSYRMMEERAHSGYLFASGGDEADYRRLAISPAKAPYYIAWFGRTASHALLSNNTQDKVGLELFGSVRQWGDWTRVRPLDELVRALPAMIEAAGISTQFSIFDKNTLLPADLKYRYRPHFLGCPENAKEQSRELVHSGTIERWRPEADIWLPDVTKPVMLFKRSRATILLELLSQPEREALQIHNNVPDEEKAEATRVAGAIFERAIAEPSGVTLNTVPIGAHYVMMMRRDERVAVEDQGEM